MNSARQQDTRLTYRNWLHFFNNEIPEGECKKKIPLKIAPKNPKKQLRTNYLTKEVKDLYAENYKTLIKEIKDDSKKWKDNPCS